MGRSERTPSDLSPSDARQRPRMDYGGNMRRRELSRSSPDDRGERAFEFIDARRRDYAELNYCGARTVLLKVTRPGFGRGRAYLLIYLVIRQI